MMNFAVVTGRNDSRSRVNRKIQSQKCKSNKFPISVLMKNEEHSLIHLSR